MNAKHHLWTLLVTVAVTSAVLTPASALAQHSSKHRQQTKNSWRNAAIAAGAIGAYGLLKGDDTLALVGAAGALYSADRYEHDRKSQSKADRERAAIFRRGYYYSHGHKYVKRTIHKNGHTYYRFVRTKATKHRK